MKKIGLILLLITSLITFVFIINYLTKTSECEHNYSVYLDYMDRANYVAIMNGFGEQSVYTYEEYCNAN